MGQGWYRTLRYQDEAFSSLLICCLGPQFLGPKWLLQFGPLGFHSGQQEGKGRRAWSFPWKSAFWNLVIGPQLLEEKAGNEDFYAGWHRLAKKRGSTSCRIREESIVEGGCRFCPQLGAWRTEIQKAFYPLGALDHCVVSVSPRTVSCRQTLCLIGLYNPDASPVPGMSK